MRSMPWHAHAIVWTAMLCLAPVACGQTAVTQVMVQFDRPSMGVVEGADGNFYGTTMQGGTHALGSIFLRQPAWSLEGSST
jgi:uncharacterized repeat protein (TIGR03803 family)